MAYDDLRGFIKALEKQGELKRIPFEVDPYLEITEFADRSVKTGGPALLFEKARQSNMPVLINAFASMKRMQIALEVDSVEEIAAKISGADHDAEAGRAAGQAEDAAEARGSGVGVSQNGFERALQGRDPQSGQAFAEGYSGAALLAAGWRSLYHAADGVHA